MFRLASLYVGVFFFVFLKGSRAFCFFAFLLVSVHQRHNSGCFILFLFLYLFRLCVVPGVCFARLRFVFLYSILCVLFFSVPFFFFLFAGSCGVRGERAAWAEGTEARAEAKAVQTDDFRAGDGPPTYIAVVFPPLARLGVVSDVKARGRFSV